MMTSTVKERHQLGGQDMRILMIGRRMAAGQDMEIPAIECKLVALHE